MATKKVKIRPKRRLQYTVAVLVLAGFFTVGALADEGADLDRTVRENKVKEELAGVPSWAIMEK